MYDTVCSVFCSLFQQFVPRSFIVFHSLLPSLFPSPPPSPLGWAKVSFGSVPRKRAHTPAVSLRSLQSSPQRGGQTLRLLRPLLLPRLPSEWPSCHPCSCGPQLGLHTQEGQLLKDGRRIVSFPALERLGTRLKLARTCAHMSLLHTRLSAVFCMAADKLGKHGDDLLDRIKETLGKEVYLFRAYSGYIRLGVSISLWEFILGV